MVDVWYQDESRIGQQGSLTRMWAEKGTRPRVVRQQQFNYTYIFGAVCPARDEAVGLVMPYTNTDTMQIHLEYISAKIPNGRHCVLIMDQAGWHTTKKLKKFDNFKGFGSGFGSASGVRKSLIRPIVVKILQYIREYPC